MIRADCSVASLERERSLINLYFEEVKHYNSDFLLLLDSDDEGTQKWLSELIGKYSKLNAAIDDHVTRLVESTRSNRPKIQLEKILLPKFDSDRRCYSRFKSDFVELIMPILNDKKASFVLCQCFSKDINQYFYSCGNTEIATKKTG